MLTGHRFPRLLAALAFALGLVPLFSTGAAATPGVSERFVDYYNAHQGLRVLGNPLTELVEVQRYPAQYFEKGRIEDHTAEVTNPNWQFMYGRLTAELMDRDPAGAVSGTTISYGDISKAADPARRNSAPPGFTGGTKSMHDGMFVPFDPFLRPAPGYVVAPYFWAYINRADLFPGGWLHDIGLPLTDPFTAKVTKQTQVRNIFVQAFERAVLTYDMQNPAGWQVEKGNIGSDAVRTLGPGIVPTPGPASGPVLELPAASQRVIPPVHILARFGQPGQQATARLRWQDGTLLTDTFTLLSGEDGQGLLIGNLDWKNMLAPPEPKTQAATLDILDSKGVLVLSRQLTVLSPNDLNTQEIKLYWTISGAPDIVQPQTRRMIKTQQPASAALEELLWGPPTISQVGFSTAIPTPRDVLAYLGRDAGWGPRVKLLGVNIDSNGIATADFSKELKAYGGGSLRVKLIRDQITMTLKQFPSVREVRIAIEGQTEGVLEP